MLLLRRRPRDKDAPASEPAPVPAPPAAVPAARTTATKPPSPPPPSAPPPLPQRPAGPTGTGSPQFTRCFVCGSALDHGACPVCRIAWVE